MQREVRMRPLSGRGRQRAAGQHRLDAVEQVVGDQRLDVAAFVADTVLGDVHDAGVTHDVSTLAGHAFARVAAGQAMPGVFAVPSMLAVGRAIDDLLLLTECSHSGEWDGRVQYLPLKPARLGYCEPRYCRTSGRRESAPPCGADDRRDERGWGGNGTGGIGPCRRDSPEIRPPSQRMSPAAYDRKMTFAA